MSRFEQATQWFSALRDQLCEVFETIEAEGGGDARFTRTDWQRTEGGGGTMAAMKGKVFEKVGVNVSTVSGRFSEVMCKEIPGAADKPYFWASGVSLVSHMRNPHVPAAHMNTRMIAVSDAPIDPDLAADNVSIWFGGGGDLTPTFPNDKDTNDFHDTFKRACDAFDPDYYPKYKAWCDEYFYLKHRKEMRGIGGIFYDYLKENWQEDFAFTQSVGKAFLEIYPTLIRRHMHTPYTQQERDALLHKRGRYVEFNLLYDRGTRFGLMTDGNVEAILMSMPPEVKWA